MGEIQHKALHFTVQGEFITNLAREMLFERKDLAGAIRLLRSSLCSDQLDSDKQLMLCLQILHGAAWIEGCSGTDEYGVDFRDDLETQPTNLSSISQLIMDMNARMKEMEKQLHDAYTKIGFLADNIEEWKLGRVNADYYNEFGEPLFGDMRIPDWMKAENQLSGMDSMLEDFMEQRKRQNRLEEEGEEAEDYGWLEPDGTWHPVEWGNHSSWAGDWLNDRMPYKENPDIYWRTDNDGKKHYIANGDVLVYSLGWVLMDSPHQGLARPTKNPAKDYTKAQKEFLYDYYIERGRNEEASALYKDD